MFPAPTPVAMRPDHAAHRAARRAALVAATFVAVVTALVPSTARVGAIGAAQGPAPARLTAVVTLGRNTVAGVAAPNAEVAIEVAGAGGAVKGSAAGRSIPLLGYFSLDAVDADGQPAPAGAGDRVTVRAGEAAIADTVPALSAAGDADADRVTGRAPAGAAVTVTVQSGLGFDAVARGAVADGGGAFAVDFSGAYDLQGGTTLRVDHVDGPFTFRVERPLTEELAIRLYDSTVGGVGPAGARITIELSRRGDEVAARGETTVGFLGLWSAPLVNAAGAAVDVRSGDRLRLLQGGAPVLDYTVPQLTVLPDAAADTVRGTAPAGSAVRVTVGGGANPPAQTATAGADGAWQASFAGQVDIAPGTSGQLAIGERRSGINVTVTRAWAITRLAVRLGEPVVNGVATPGDGVRLTLKDSRGTAKAAAAVEVDAGGFFGGGATFAATLANPKGDSIDVRPNDTLAFEQGAERFDVPIPVLTADIDAAADTVTGQAPAGAALRVTASLLFFTNSVDVVADAGGRYRADFAGRFDLVGGIGVEVVYTLPAGHTVTLATAASSVRVWPEAGRVDGSVAGGADVTVSALTTTGQVKGRGTDTANFLGQFDALLFDLTGKPYFPVAGDRIRIQFNNASKEMIVPAVGIEWDTVRERVFGEATPGGTVTVRGRPPAGQGNGAVQRALPIDAVGAYAAEFAPDLDLRAASRLEITYAYPNGDRSRIDRLLPYLDVQVGGNAVGGYALPRSAVAGRLMEGATVLGSGDATSDGGQAFALRLARSGRAVPITTGRTVEVEFEARRISVVADNLSARFVRDASTTALDGTGPVSTALTARFVGANGQPRNATVTTDAAGAFRLALPGGIDGLGGTTASVAFLNGEGHRQWALAVIARLVAYIGTPRVDLSATPLAAARLTLAAAAGGAALGTADVETDTTGQASATLGSAAQLLRAGQSIRAAIGQGAAAEQAAMTVADVRLSLDTPRNTVTGHVPVGEGVLGRFAQVRLWPRDGGAARTVAVRTDAEGNFTLDTANPPGFGAQGAALASFAQVQVVHTDAQGHQTVAAETVRIVVYAPYVARMARR